MMSTLPHRYSQMSRMITEVSDPYTKEYRAEFPMISEKIIDAAASAAAAPAAPGTAGGLGLSRGAVKR